LIKKDYSHLEDFTANTMFLSNCPKGILSRKRSISKKIAIINSES